MTRAFNANTRYVSKVMRMKFLRSDVATEHEHVKRFIPQNRTANQTFYPCEVLEKKGFACATIVVFWASCTTTTPLTTPPPITEFLTEK